MTQDFNNLEWVEPLASWHRLRFMKGPWEKVHALVDKPNTLPRKQDWYRAYELTPFDCVKVVILGQDPYPIKGYANGLCFSVQPHVKPLPGSLRNIFKEYTSDLGTPSPRTGDLTRWAEEGVLLLNSILTVEEGRPLSHSCLGWERLTYEVVSLLSRKREAIVWMLWGSKAQEYSALIYGNDHLVLTGGHPSPRNTVKSFLGGRYFSKANEYLTKKGIPPVNWCLT